MPCVWYHRSALSRNVFPTSICIALISPSVPRNRISRLTLPRQFGLLGPSQSATAHALHSFEGYAAHRSSGSACEQPVPVKSTPVGRCDFLLRRLAITRDAPAQASTHAATASRPDACHPIPRIDAAAICVLQ
eukprot:3282592-Pleurochrysis_carterae.AAC.1